MQVGEQVGGYKITRHLAKGGMGDLWLATSADAGALPVAIKQMHPQLAYDSSFLDMFLDEARIASQIHHPNVVQVYELTQHEGSYYMVMEYLHGQPLSSLLKEAAHRQELLPARLAIGITLDVCAALACVHAQCSPMGRPLEIVHRDVTPDNLILTYDGDVKLVDFGIARAVERLHATQPGHTKGKRLYMSPEQYLGKKVGPATDLYSIGVVLWELLVGRHLFSPDASGLYQDLQQRKNLIPPSREVSSLPPALDAAVLRALAYEVKDRFESCASFGAALGEIMKTEGWASVRSDRAALVTAYLPSHEVEVASTDPDPNWDDSALEVTAPRPRKLATRPDPSTDPDAEWTDVSGMIGQAIDLALRRERAARVAFHDATTSPQLAAAAPPTVATEPVSAEAVAARAAASAPAPLRGSVYAAGAALALCIALGLWWIAHASGPKLTVEQLPVQHAQPTPTPSRSQQPIPSPIPVPSASPIPSSSQVPSPSPTATPTPLAAGTRFVLLSTAPVAVMEKNVTLGRAPSRDLHLEPGRHHLRLVNAQLGIDQVLDVAVSGEEEVTRKVSFARGSIRVTSVGPADVAIDGKPLGMAPRRIELSPGTHSVEVKNGVPTLRRHVEKVTLRSGETLTLQCNLLANRCGRVSRLELDAGQP